MSAGRLAALALIILTATAAATTPVLAKAKADHKASPSTLASFPAALTQKQAVQVVLQYYRENNQANKALSVALQNKDEEGISARMDDANYGILSLEGKTNAGSSSFLPKTKNISVYLTGATGAPAEFLAAIRYPAAKKPAAYPAETSYFVFRKDSKRSPWRVLYEQSVSSKTKVVTVTQNNGLATVKAHASHRAVATYVGYLNTGKGKVARGSYTSETYSELLKASAHASSNTLTESFRFSVDSSPVVSVAVAGGTLEFGGADEVDTTVPGNSSGCVSAGASGNPAILALAPAGVGYTKIALRSVAQVTLFVPASKRKLVRVLDDYSEIMSASAPLAGNCSPTS